VSDTQKYAVSIRLDSEAQRNLNLLEASGLSRSEAIRKGLQVAADQLRRSEMIYAEAQMVANDQYDRREMLEIAAFMESLRVEG
jgi:Arc/MetJ-type ribon-helix-helix transcriptional regulator